MTKKYYTMEEMQAKWNEEDIWRKNHPVLARLQGWFYRIEYFIFNLPKQPKNIYRNIKWFIQRGTRGWADCDVWEFYPYHSRVVYSMLVSLKKNKMGFPATLNPETGEYDDNEERWNQILDKMIYAYKLNVDVANGDREVYSPYYPTDLKKQFNCLTQREDCDRRLGMMLFDSYYFSLWD